MAPRIFLGNAGSVMTSKGIIPGPTPLLAAARRRVLPLFFLVRSLNIAAGPPGKMVISLIVLVILLVIEEG